MLSTLSALYGHLAETGVVVANPAALNLAGLGLSSSARHASPTVRLTAEQLKALLMGLATAIARSRRRSATGVAPSGEWSAARAERREHHGPGSAHQLEPSRVILVRKLQPHGRLSPRRTGRAQVVRPPDRLDSHDRPPMRGR
jgi:hypothetical protein